jgi:hypothetical protein
VEENRRWWRRSGARRAVRGGDASSSSDDGLMGPVAAEPRVKIRVLVCRTAMVANSDDYKGGRRE